MSTRARRERDKQELRAAILNAARTIMEDSGAGYIAVREIAKRIEYSPSVIYAYFEGRDAIINHLFLEGVDLFGKMMQAAAGREQTPLGRLRALAHAYRQFALENPELYRILFDRPIPGYTIPAELANRLYGQLEALAVAIQDCILTGSLRPINPVSAAHVAWATMHGFVSLEINGVQSTIPSDEVYMLAINSLLGGWKF